MAAGIGRAQRQQSNLLAPTMANKLNRNDMDKRNNNGISRRTALKRMGMLMAGASCLGLPTLTSCDMETKKRIILYFTATGNCLYVARELADKHTELLSIPQMMKQKRYTFEADEIGIVYPVYGHMPPNMVREFINKARLTARYKFAILTYGNRKCSSVEIWDDISRKAGCAFDYITTMIMVDNWLPNFDMNEQIKIDKHIPESLDRITADINSHRRWHEPVTELERQQHAGFLKSSGVNPEVCFKMMSQEAFAVTDSCIGCGICTEVCPRGNYTLTSTGVKTEGDCEFCFACIHNCPQKAIVFKQLKEVNPNARYRNEHVSLWSIKEANRQNKPTE